MVRTLAERLDGLLDGMLEFTRLGRVALVTAPHALDALARDAVPRAEARAATLRGRMPADDTPTVVRLEGAWPTITCDGARVTQLFEELIANGLAHNDAPTRAVTLAVAPAVEGGAVRVTVRDNGVGIAPADRERAFALFARVGRGADEATSPARGVGLTLARRIAERHGGGVQLDAAPDGGTIATVVLG